MDQDTAAIKIQALQRGRQARKEVADRKDREGDKEEGAEQSVAAPPEDKSAKDVFLRPLVMEASEGAVIEVAGVEIFSVFNTFAQFVEALLDEFPGRRIDPLQIHYAPASAPTSFGNRVSARRIELLREVADLKAVLAERSAAKDEPPAADDPALKKSKKQQEKDEKERKKREKAREQEIAKLTYDLEVKQTKIATFEDIKYIKVSFVSYLPSSVATVMKNHNDAFAARDVGGLTPDYTESSVITVANMHPSPVQILRFAGVEAIRSFYETLRGQTAGMEAVLQASTFEELGEGGTALTSWKLGGGTVSSVMHFDRRHFVARHTMTLNIPNLKKLQAAA